MSSLADLDDFMRAASGGEVERLRDFPEFVNTRYEKATALHFAAIAGQIEAAAWLLDQGADPNALDDEFHATPLSWANESGQKAMVDFLSARDVEIGPEDAAAIGLLDHLKELVRRDPGILDRRWPAGSLLHIAAIWGQAEVAAWLVEQGVDRNLASDEGLTAIEISEAQAACGTTHTPLVDDVRREQIEQSCARIATWLRVSK